MDFDNDVLDALAHLDSAPAAPTNIKTFKSVTPSARSPPPSGNLVALRVILTVYILMPVMDIVTKLSVTRTEILLMQLVWLVTARSSRCLLREVICLTWRPRSASLRQLLHWLKKAFAPTRFCKLADVSIFTFPKRWQLREGGWVR